MLTDSLVKIILDVGFDMHGSPEKSAQKILVPIRYAHNLGSLRPLLRLQVRKTGKAGQKCDRAGRCPLLGKDQPLSAGTGGFGPLRIGQTFADRCWLGRPRSRTTRAASSASSNSTTSRKFCVFGAEEHGRPVAGRLDHVLPAAIAEAAPHECHVGQPPARGQLAQGVQQEDRLVGREFAICRSRDRYDERAATRGTR